jgi:DNA-binding NarL/FixJ family response regulator
MATLFLIDPHPIVRAGIRSLLGELHVIAGEADDATEAIARMQALAEPVQAVVIDPKCGDAELLLSTFPDIRIIAFQESIGSGDERAHAVVSKRRDVARLSRAIDAALHGNLFHDPADPGPHDRLSPREREVLRMVMRGMRPKEIALALDVSIKTISTHRFRIMRKLGVDNDVTLMHYAFRNALATS